VCIYLYLQVHVCCQSVGAETANIFQHPSSLWLPRANFFRDAHTRTQSNILLNLRFVKAIYEDPCVKAAIRGRHDATDKSTREFESYTYTAEVSFPGIVISTHGCVFVNLRKIPDWLKSSEIESFRHSASLRRADAF